MVDSTKSMKRNGAVDSPVSEPTLFNHFADDDSISIDDSAINAISRGGEVWEAPEDTLVIPSYTRGIEEAMQDYLRQIEGLNLDNGPEMQILMDKIGEEVEVTLEILTNVIEKGPARDNKRGIASNKLLRSSTFALNQSLMEIAAYDQKIAKLSQALQITLSQVDVLGELFSRANQSRIEAKLKSDTEKRKNMGKSSPAELCVIPRVETPKTILAKHRRKEFNYEKKKANRIGGEPLSEKQLYRARPDSIATLHLYGYGASRL